MRNPLRLVDVKEALRDGEFRSALPKSYQPLIEKYLQNPSCGCNGPFYKKIILECKEQLKQYFPAKDISGIEEELKKLSSNNWTVINCHIDELETELKRLPAGRKQIAVARFEDQATVIVNELDVT